MVIRRKERVTEVSEIGAFGVNLEPFFGLCFGVGGAEVSIGWTCAGYSRVVAEER